MQAPGERRSTRAAANAAVRAPAPLTTLIGRNSELSATRKLLLDPNVRLLTLTGAPGTGKTHLAIALTEALIDDFPDGIWFVPLATLRRPDLLVPTIAQTLGVGRISGRPLIETLIAASRRLCTLLVLDNFEQILPAASDVADLLANCLELKVLATSRAPLHIRGEHRFPVPPLAIPGLEPLPTIADLAHVPAVQLFVERTAAVRPDFQLCTDNARAVAELCVRVEGLPLSIELAAARGQLLDPGQLLARLERRLALLTHGPRDLPVRQRTLRAAIAWSYDLLEPREQRLFRQLSVFAGGWTTEAAEIVTRDEDDPDADTLEGVATLLEHSLLRKESQRDGLFRLDMLETIREFAAEQLLACGELELTGQRHASYFTALAEQGANPRLDGSNGVALLACLEREHDNLRAALRWLLAHGNADEALQLAGALWSFWEMHGDWSEGLAWLDAALTESTSGTSATRARALIGVAALCRAEGRTRYALSVGAARESVTLRRRLGDEVGLAESLLVLADLIAVAEPAEASRLAAESASIRRQRGDAVGTVWSLLVLGQISAWSGDNASARAHYEEALGLRGGQRDNTVDVHLLRSLGVLYAATGDAARAGALLEQALEVATARNTGDGVIWSLLALGDLALRQGDTTAGERYLERCRIRALELGNSLAVIIACLRLRRPVADDLLREVGEPLLATGWHAALGSDMPPLSQLRATTRSVAARPVSSASPSGLTRRELEVLRLLARHYTNAEMADELVLSIRTVERHVAKIYAKIGASTRRQATAYARQHDLIDPDI
jgi:predicted ATPase/DNA-binding CsgD family transcriptional regulator